jgi:hypothetical protein
MRLRALITEVRLDKSRLAAAIASPSISPERRQQLIYRYSALVQELRMYADELEKLIAVARRSEYERDRR